MQGAEIRRSFIEFFTARGHTHVESSSLVPYGDPTLLFTNAGMVQFKDLFLGLEQRPYRRAVTAQRCVRAGGKHNDLEEVGRTPRHHTFFEMLGNFSFGDYFKEEAIGFAWELVTRVWGLDPGRLWITVFQEDEQARSLWQRVAGVRPERILGLGAKENFWSMGEVGPCGPCSEMLYDRGEEHRCQARVCAPGVCDCDRWLEFYNLVFMQFNRDREGGLTPLPKPSIDTGMGLERMASILQGVPSNFDTDLFTPILARLEEITGKTYDPGPGGFAFRVAADHARASTFLLTDGVRPSNEGRGYVLRRIIRRAVRIAQQLEVRGPFLHRLVEPVVATLGEAYPELKAHAASVGLVLAGEEERFWSTLEEGSRLLDERIAALVARGERVMDGEDAFVLYDTYGYPVELTEEVLAEAGLSIDHAGFAAALEEQRRRARADRAQGRGPDLGPLVAQVAPTRFCGYESLEEAAQVLWAWDEEAPRSRLVEGQRGGVLLDTTPFYPEGGGQWGDTGALEGPGGRFRVEDTQRVASDRILHLGTMERGTLAVGEKVRAVVDGERRRATQRNHTATHLLHAALRAVLGEHVQQAGSVVEASRLRFDFSHPTRLTESELAQVEELVNRRILDDLAVGYRETSLAEARRLGAMALFGEKYRDRVRLVEVDGFSRELCGGTHVHRTGEIGLFTVTDESGVGAGIRRIEAVTGMGSLRWLNEQRQALIAIASAVNAPVAKAPARIEELKERARRLQAEHEEYLLDLFQDRLRSLMAQAPRQGSARLTVGRLDAPTVDLMRRVVDRWRSLEERGILVLASVTGPDHVDLMAAATPDLVSDGAHMGRLMARIAPLVGGKGGGRADLAQGGGHSPAGIEAALREALRIGEETVRGGMAG